MALVTCPHCKKTVNNTSNKCPNCGTTLKYSILDKDAPKYARLQIFSNISLIISFVLLLIELLGNVKTYVGGIFLGVGFMFQAMSLLDKEKQEDFDGKKRGMIVVWISIALILGGIFFLYMDLR